jgi:hypothetical protein
VRDPQQAASIRQWLAMGEGHDVAEDRASEPAIWKKGSGGVFSRHRPCVTIDTFIP